MTQHSKRQALRACDGEFPRRLRRVRRLGAVVASCTAVGVVGAELMFVATPSALAQTGGQPLFETIVTAAPAVLHTSPLMLTLFDLSATLNWVAPIANEPIVFTAGGTTLCTATTNGMGVASCDVLANLSDVTAVLAAGGYTATFAGDHSFAPGYAPSSGKAGLIQ
ncbi:MAG TPA: hypothetical protein VHU85_08370 [Acidimicrobiales bacterium]|jgi:hypothetical protein|nr:hypothetical protein [Acidimicrobiales bacterium]